MWDKGDKRAYQTADAELIYVQGCSTIISQNKFIGQLQSLQSRGHSKIRENGSALNEYNKAIHLNKYHQVYARLANYYLALDI